MRYSAEFHRAIGVGRGRAPAVSFAGARRALAVAVLGGSAIGLLGWDVTALGESAGPGSPSSAGSTRAAAYPARQFGFCHTGGGTNCVVDGDTFWIDGEKVRIADIDAPETHPPRCAGEAALGARATGRLRELLNGGPVVLAVEGRATDRYGRALRIVTRGGASLGRALVEEGLAREWDGRRRGWCAGLS